ncbi:MAG: D-Ala-D-Ala carboxypeptidase family metallohydrolase [Pseudomonadota bacterium]
MTSGRRTAEGNRAVGGVLNSMHVPGNAVDYDGPDLNALLGEVKLTFPGARAFIHKGHVHAQDRRIRAPYFGRHGTIGLKGR